MLLRFTSGIGFGMMVILIWGVISSAVATGQSSWTDLILFTSIFVLPFLFLGALIAWLYMRKNEKYRLLFHLALGIILTVFVMTLFDLSWNGYAFFQVGRISMVGAIANYVGWSVKRRALQACFSIFIPVFFLVLFVLEMLQRNM